MNKKDIGVFVSWLGVYCCGILYGMSWAIDHTLGYLIGLFGSVLFALSLMHWAMYREEHNGYPWGTKSGANKIREYLKGVSMARACTIAESTELDYDLVRVNLSHMIKRGEVHKFKIGSKKLFAWIRREE